MAVIHNVRRPASTGRGLILRENWRTFRLAAWLGWQLEANWADPLVFLIFSVLRPLASALILVVMFQVIAGGQRGGFFDYLYLSNAFFMLVISALSGMPWAILEDREHFRMLKYIYTSPARKLAYLSGRAVAKLALGLLTTVVLLGTGALLLGLRLDINRVQWGWLVPYFLLGMVVLLALGLVLAGVALVVARHGGFIGEVVGGSLLLFSGAYFPIDILPPVLREVGLLLPVTYWLEAMRRAMTGGIVTITESGISGAGTAPVQHTPVSPALAGIDNGQLLLILMASAAICALGAYLFYSWVERLAKERGMIDRLTGY
jgi:ABC-2 type transport system permease protein